MTLHIDCSTCPGKPRACGDCAVGLLLGPVVAVAPQVTSEPEGEGGVDLNDAIAAFADAGMLPRLHLVPDQRRRAG